MEINKEILEKHLARSLAQKLQDMTRSRTEQEITFYQGQLFFLKSLAVEFDLKVESVINLEVIYDHVKKEETGEVVQEVPTKR